MKEAIEDIITLSQTSTALLDYKKANHDCAKSETVKREHDTSLHEAKSVKDSSKLKKKRKEETIEVEKF